MFTHQVQEFRKGTYAEKTLSFRGEVTSHDMNELQQIFSETLRSCSHLLLDLQGLNETDVSFVMLVCATSRAAALVKKLVTIIGPLPVDYLEHFKYLRYSGDTGCPFNLCRHCRFWSFMTDNTSE